MTSLKVHFDGRVLVPEGPIDLPRDYVFEVLIPDSLRPVSSDPDNVLAEIPLFPVPPNATILRADVLKDAQDD